MDLFRMRCFVAVAEAGSISKAARELYISQPAMSAHMNAVEAALGAQLLVRGRQTHLTPVGEVALHGFRGILAAYDRLESDVAVAQEREYGLLSVGFHGPVNWLGMTDLLKQFRHGHPETQLHVSIGTWGNVLQQLLDGTIDVAFLEESEIEGLAEVAYQRFYEEPVCAILPLGHPLADRPSVSVREIADEVMMLYDPATSPRFFHALRESFLRAGVTVEEVGSGNHFEAAITLVKAGCGISCMPATLACDYTDLVACVPFSDLAVSMRYCLTWSRERTSALTSEFVTLAREMMG